MVLEASEDRRLTTIMAIDVVGYSRLMSEDEAGTLAALKEIRGNVLVPLVKQFGGRIFKFLGDGALVEFPSVIKAVQCAVELQASWLQNFPNFRRGQSSCASGLISAMSSRWAAIFTGQVLTSLRASRASPSRVEYVSPPRFTIM